MQVLCTIAFIALAELSQGAVSGDTVATLEIRPVQVRGVELGHYFPDAPIPIQLEVSNGTDHEIDVTLNEHYRDGRQHRLWGLKVRVRDAEGNVLTQHDFLEPELRDWWTFGYLHSDIASCVIGFDCYLFEITNTVTLTPRELVRRTVYLDWILLGAPSLHGPLSPGQYSLEVRLNNLTSNSLKIWIDTPHKKNEIMRNGAEPN